MVKTIERILKDSAGIPRFGDTPMFQKITYVNQQNRQEYPEYMMNRDCRYTVKRSIPHPQNNSTTQEETRVSAMKAGE